VSGGLANGRRQPACCCAASVTVLLLCRQCHRPAAVPPAPVSPFCCCAARVTVLLPRLSRCFQCHRAAVLLVSPACCAARVTGVGAAALTLVAGLLAVGPLLTLALVRAPFASGGGRGGAAAERGGGGGGGAGAGSCGGVDRAPAVPSLASAPRVPIDRRDRERPPHQSAPGAPPPERACARPSRRPAAAGRRSTAPAARVPAGVQRAPPRAPQCARVWQTNFLIDQELEIKFQYLRPYLRYQTQHQS
jgi:hypothetical protein